MSTVIKASFNDKIEKKTADYRLSLVHVVSYLIKNHSHTKVLAIFETLLNIQHLLYMPYGKGTNETILSLNTSMFKHVIVIKEIVGRTPKNTKFYGKYFHALTRHAGDYYRIDPGSTIHTEKEERSFTRVKSITNNTSNRHAHNMLSTMILFGLLSATKEKKKLLHKDWRIKYQRNTKI